MLIEGDREPEEAADGATDDLIEEQRARLEENPNDVGAMGLLAELLAYDGKLSEAIAWYQKALELDPTNTAIRLAFGQTLAEADLRNDAELQFLKVLQAEPSNYEAHYYLAELYRFWDPPRSDDAAFHYRRVIEIAPDAFLATRSGEMLVMMGYATPARSGSPAATPPANATPSAA
jgi:cytochrome c-type biogenesis protein CcmH/NrfG